MSSTTWPRSPARRIAAREPELTEQSNLVGARLVLEAARERGARVVFGGSFRVYGDDLDGQTVDEHTPYGRVGDLSHLSKIYVEQLARMLGVPFVSVRLGVTYGLSPIMKTTPAFMTVPNLFCQRAARGEPLRCSKIEPMAFIHVRDAAEALLAAADALAAPRRHAVGGGQRRARGGHHRPGGAHRAAPGADARRRRRDSGRRARLKRRFQRAVVARSTTASGRCTLADGLGEVLDCFDAAAMTVLITGASGLIGRHTLGASASSAASEVRTFQRGAARHARRAASSTSRAMCAPTSQAAVRRGARLPGGRAPGRARRRRRIAPRPGRLRAAERDGRAARARGGARSRRRVRARLEPARLSAAARPVPRGRSRWRPTARTATPSGSPSCGAAWPASSSALTTRVLRFFSVYGPGPAGQRRQRRGHDLCSRRAGRSSRWWSNRPAGATFRAPSTSPAASAWRVDLPPDGRHRVYNVATGIGTTFRQLAELIDRADRLALADRPGRSTEPPGQRPGRRHQPRARRAWLRAVRRAARGPRAVPRMAAATRDSQPT